MAATNKFLQLRNLLMRRRLLLAGVAALSVLAALAAAHAETKEARVILPDIIAGTWCWVEGGDEKNRNQQIFIRSAPEVRWLRLSEQNFRVDKWSLCRG